MYHVYITTYSTRIICYRNVIDASLIYKKKQCNDKQCDTQQGNN